MKKIIVFGICIFLLFLNVFSVQGADTHTKFYEEDWNSGTAEGWTEYNTNGALAAPRYSANLFDTSGGGQPANAVKNINLSDEWTDRINVSFTYAKGLQYIAIGVTNRSTVDNSNYVYGMDIHIQWYYQSNDIRWFRNTTQETSTTYTKPTAPFEASNIFYRNGTVKFYNEHGLQGTYSFADPIDDNYNHLVIMSRGQADGIDDLEVWSYAEAGAAPALSLTNDLIDGGNYTDNPLQVNYTGVCTDCNGGIYDCSLYVDDVYNSTQFSRNFTDPGNTYNFTIDTTAWERSVELNISCEEGSPLGDPTEETSATIFVDTVLPNIIQGDITNNSILYHNINDINVSVEFQDTNLFYTNLSIQRLNSDYTWNSTINYTEVTNITTTSQVLNITNNINTLDTGIYQLAAFAADSHTDNKVRDIDWYWHDNKLYAGGLIFEGNIKDVNNQNNLVTYFWKDEDRYKFKVTFDDHETSHDIIITAPEWLYVGEQYGYKGHFISLSEMRWLDFMGTNVDSVDITDLGNNKYNIHVEHYYSTDEIEFESIGDLNTIESIWYFNVSTGFSFSAIDAITNAQINSFEVSIINGTDILETKSTTDGNLTFSWFGNYTTNVTSSGYVNNETSNISMFSGGTFQYNLFAANSLYLFFFDESTDQLINTTNITITTINLANTSYENTTDTGSIFIKDFAVGDYELQFNADGYSQNSYFVTISSGTTQAISLYMVNDSLSSLIVFNLADEKGNPITSATLKRKRFMVADNAFVVTGMSKTDSNGETSMYLVANDVFYQFVVDKDNQTIFSGDQQKIFSSTVYLRISILEDIFQSYELVHGVIEYDLTWNNDTDIVSITYNDPSNLVLTGCLRVVENDVFTQTIYGPNCTTSASATINMNMSGLTNNRSQYLAQFYVETNSTYSEPMIAQIAKSYKNTFAQFGDPGLYVSYLFIGTMFFVGLPISFSIALLYSILSMIVVQTIGISFFGWTMIVTISVMGIIVGSVIKN